MGTDALIYVVDCNDPERLSEAAGELHKMLAEDGLRDAVVLVMANKQDLPRALRTDKVMDALSLHSLRRPWYVQPCSALSGDGVIEGLDWVQQALRKQRNRRQCGVALAA